MMTVKENQKKIMWDVKRVFDDTALVAATGTSKRTCDKGHGRLERRRLWKSNAWSAKANGRVWKRRSDWSGRWCGSIRAKCNERWSMR